MKGTLFSNYFLEEGIKATEDWKKLSEKELEKLYSEISKTFKSFSKRKRPDEADTEDDLIRPIIELFGFQWSRQKSPSKKGRHDVPDFVLFQDEKSKEEFDREAPNCKPWDKAICILEGKRWKRHLDKGDKTDPIDPHVPSNQILRYLSVAEPASNGKIVWGILTNGEIWRLYYHKAPSRSEGFIEFNLSDVLGELTLFDDLQNKKEKFKIFYLLFRKEAFIPTDWRPHDTFLEIALEEGKRWEERVSENLKEKIFCEVFPNIAKGFLIDVKNKGKNVDNAVLREIYNNTLVLLYRLLFILYAEDRDLLPVRSDEYKNYSLSKIRDEVAEKIDKGETLSETGPFYWDRMKNLFRIINYGDKSLKIPPYNGGLFDPQKHPFLENFSVPDKFLVPAIDKLSREHTVNPPKRINYRDLSVRQLGSIYEGLLEFKLKIAETHLGVKKEKGKEVYYPVNDENEAKIKKGEPYLTNDKSERKATGSYYTPDYVVQYIVKNSIEPLIQEKLREFENWKDALKTKNGEELLKLIEELNVSFDDSSENIELEKKLNAYKNALLSVKDPAKAILKLKILDPAMGSGHFLVGAVDYLADRILEILAETSEKNYFGEEVYQSPLLNELENIRNRILEKAQKEDYIIDETKLDDKNLIKRIILKQCIYGVDLNPLAVELAKVSLWLHTFTMGAPLSFLDHHLKCGNSLIGANPEDFDRVLKKSPLFGSRYTGLINAVKMIEKLQEITDADVSEVEESAKIYDDVIKELEPYKKLLDVYTADFFLKPKKKSELKKYQSPLTLINGTKGDPLKVVCEEVSLTKDEKKLLEKALNLAKDKRFFHWKLEFPEVWYGDKKSNGGFDIVIGNPPYGAEFDDKEKHYFKDVFCSNTKDSSAYFIEKSLNIASSHFGMILPKSLAFYREWESIRSYIFKNSLIQYVGNVGIAFKDANYEQLILILTKKTKSTGKNYFKVDTFKPLKKPTYIKKLQHSSKIETSIITTKNVIVFHPITDKEQNIIKKIEKISAPLNSFADREVFRGIYIPDNQKKDILNQCKYVPVSSPKYLLFVNKVPDVKRYLVEKIYLIPKDKIENIARVQLIEKIMRPRIFFKVLRGKRLICYPDTDGKLLTTEKLVNLVLKDEKYSYHFITAIVNSKVPSWYLEKTIFSCTTETSRVMDDHYLKYLPIPKIDFSSKNEDMLNELRLECDRDEFLKIQDKIKSLPSNSAILHDFLSFLAKKMIELNQNKHLLNLFIESKIQSGTNEMIKVIELLETHPEWKDGTSGDYKKEIARNLLSELENQIKQTDKLIDQIVYHLYGLNEDDINIIEQFFSRN